MEETKIYLDANIFIYATVNTQEIGNKCRSLLKEIEIGKIKGITSCLTFDEIIWILRKIAPEKVLESARNILNLNIKFMEVNKNILYKLVDLIEKYKLKPRDAIHLATMELNNCKTIISEDSDFDKIPEIERINPIKLEFFNEESENLEKK